MGTLVKFLPRLEKAALAGPGKHELGRVFLAHREWARGTDGEHSFYALTDPYGTILGREKDVQWIIDRFLPPAGQTGMKRSRAD